MGADVDNAKDEVVGDKLAERIIKMMSSFKFPGSLRVIKIQKMIFFFFLHFF